MVEINSLKKEVNIGKTKNCITTVGIFFITFGAVVISSLLAIILGNEFGGLFSVNNESWRGIINSSLTTVVTVLGAFYIARYQIKQTKLAELENIKKCIKELLGNEIKSNSKIYNEWYSHSVNKNHELKAPFETDNWKMIYKSLIKLREIKKYDKLIESCIELYRLINKANYYIILKLNIEEGTRENLIEKIKNSLDETNKLINETDW